MFTGIVETLGSVLEVGQTRLEVTPQTLGWASDLELGESISVNGACLTAAPGSQRHRLVFDVSPETFSRTSLGALCAGSVVNLERAARLNSRMGGHLVLGHVDATGTIVSRRDGPQFSEFEVQAPLEYDRYLIDKGSVCLDGISLTVVQPSEGKFGVWIIPTTLENTNMQDLREGAKVNLEFDLIAKHLEKLLKSSTTPQG